ncbi:RNA polymerase sigma factor [Streptomyces virginiae]|uniref:RNA polymerase sigma factor n=1 Tax=Streptomyces virginiae TaxID=1961 RepID=UPI003643262B
MAEDFEQLAHQVLAVTILTLHYWGETLLALAKEYQPLLTIVWIVIRAVVLVVKFFSTRRTARLARPRRPPRPRRRRRSRRPARRRVDTGGNRVLLTNTSSPTAITGPRLRRAPRLRRLLQRAAPPVAAQDPCLLPPAPHRGIDAEDIVQRPFVAVLENWERVGRPASPRAYLYTVANNLVRKTFYRRSVPLTDVCFDAVLSHRRRAKIALRHPIAAAHD